ncbi:MAG: rhodanese-like domain-containing protein [Planctomycetota bacterium]
MSYRSLETSEAKALLAGPEGWKYVDVRTVEEFEAGHAAGAWNVPFAVYDRSGRMTLNAEFVAVMRKRFPPDARLVLGCASGMRSQNACELLESEGYEHLVNLAHGFLGQRDMSGRVVRPGWQACGYPCESEATPERTYAALRGPE